MIEEFPADKGAGDRKECIVNLGKPIEAQAKPPELMESGERAFDNPATDAEPTPMFGATPGKERLDSPFRELPSMRFGIVPTVALNCVRLASRTTALAANRGNGIDQGQELVHIVDVGSSQSRGERNTLGVRDNVVLTARFGSVCRVRPGFAPPKTARTEALSTMARDQSILSASRSLAKNSSWTLCHTPACCHSHKWFQQVMPHPHPISLGRSSHGIPVFKTNRMPVRTLRWSSGLRPGYRNRRGLSGGIRGSISFHSSSGRISLAMCIAPFTLALHIAIGKTTSKL